MKLIFGLGNPGPEYDYSPHNLGFGVVDRLAERRSVRVGRKQGHSLCGRFQIGEEEAWLIKPQMFMNRSGLAVGEWLAKQGCGPEDIVVIADELDLPWGQLRIRQSGGAAGHHGVESVIAALGTKQFTRVRIGVRPDHPVEDSVRYLLTPVRRSLRPSFEAMLDRAADAVEAILQEGAARAMTLFNRRDFSSPPAERKPAAEAKAKEAIH